MIGPLVNPTNPTYQSVGVFSLEIARLYGYLYQHTDKQYTILHGLDGYDEISLTGDFKTISNRGEQYYTVQQLGLDPITQEAISGGETVEDAAAIFTRVLQGEGTNAQNQVVLANAAIAIQTIHPLKSFGDCYYEAEASLLGKKALSSFKKLVGDRR